jgi:hypothetical protein
MILYYMFLIVFILRLFEFQLSRMELITEIATKTLPNYRINKFLFDFTNLISLFGNIFSCIATIIRPEYNDWRDF